MNGDNLRIDLYLHDGDPEVRAALARIEHKLGVVIKKEEQMAGELDNLTQKVQDSVTVEDSAIALLNQLSDLIRQSANDPAKLNALADQLDAEKQKVADAIVANTPAAGQ